MRLRTGKCVPIAAVPGGYDYYHLLSGVDVPVKTRQYIENYFSSVQPGTNFVHFQHKEIIHDHRDRVKFYYPLQRWNLQNRIIRLALRRTGELLQRPFVDRTKKDPEGYVFQKGANWFSITHALATYVLSQENWQRGNPYTFTDADLDELLAAPETALFARKFDYRTSPGVVDALFDRFG